MYQRVAVFGLDVLKPWRSVRKSTLRNLQWKIDTLLAAGLIVK
jgi:hypothetical protein